MRADTSNPGWTTAAEVKSWPAPDAHERDPPTGLRTDRRLFRRGPDARDGSRLRGVPQAGRSPAKDRRESTQRRRATTSWSPRDRPWRPAMHQRADAMLENSTLQVKGRILGTRRGPSAMARLFGMFPNAVLFAKGPLAVLVPFAAYVMDGRRVRDVGRLRRSLLVDVRGLLCYSRTTRGVPQGRGISFR